MMLRNIILLANLVLLILVLDLESLFFMQPFKLVMSKKKTVNIILGCQKRQEQKAPGPRPYDRGRPKYPPPKIIDFCLLLTYWGEPWVHRCRVKEGKRNDGKDSGRR